MINNYLIKLRIIFYFISNYNNLFYFVVNMFALSCRSISPVENAIVSFLASGEGWHNYHHAFPWDYKAAELGNYSLNITTAFIDFFAYLGLAYDLKTASPDTIKKCIARNKK